MAKSAPPPVKLDTQSSHFHYADFSLGSLIDCVRQHCFRAPGTVRPITPTNLSLDGICEAAAAPG